MSQAFDVIVLGAGANGLVAAAALARAGKRVLVLEQQAAIGGQARTIEFAPGFRASPITTHAGWVPPAVAKELGIRQPTQADAPLSVLLGRGDWLSLWRDAARARDAIARHSQRDAARWPELLGKLQKLAGFLAELYQLPAPNLEPRQAREVLSIVQAARRLRNLGKTEMVEFLRIMPMAVQELADDEFESEALKVALAASGVRNLRQGPRSGGTAFVLLHHLIGATQGALRHAGWWREGNAAFIGAAEQANRKHGVTIRTGTEVARIDMRADAVAGVTLVSGEEIRAPRVLSTIDPVKTFHRLVDTVWFDPEFLHAVGNIKLRGSTAAVLYALNRLPEIEGLGADAMRGTLSLTASSVALERAADAAKYAKTSPQPHIELSIPSLFAREGELAPIGQHTMVAKVQWAPYGTTIDPGAVTRAIEEAIPGFESLVADRAVLHPADLELQYGLTEGAVTQGELTLDQILFMRPVAGWGNHRSPINGLYLGGAGSHPGPDILGGAGLLAAARINSDERSKWFR